MINESVKLFPRMVRDFRSANNTNQIKRLLRVLGQDFATAQNPHIRKGSSLGLAAVAVALGSVIIFFLNFIFKYTFVLNLVCAFQDCSQYLSDLIPPILACFSDPEIRVRYFACEALYNVAKVMRGAILVHFTDIFNALSKSATDPDPNLKTASELLDRLLKVYKIYCVNYKLINNIRFIYRTLLLKVHPSIYVRLFHSYAKGSTHGIVLLGNLSFLGCPYWILCLI